MPTDSLIRRLTYALLDPLTAEGAAMALSGSNDPAAIEGLVDLLREPQTAKVGLAALQALEGTDHPLIPQALRDALSSGHALIRIAAINDAQQRQLFHLGSDLARIIRTDQKWLVRRAAIHALSHYPQPERERVLIAVDDPHWRPRHALVQILLQWGSEPQRRNEIDEQLQQAGDHLRVVGLRKYLHYRWTGDVPGDGEFPLPPDPAAECDYWDWDPLVLARNLEEMSRAGRGDTLETMSRPLAESEERVRRWAVEALRRQGQPEHLVHALSLLDDPRRGIGDSLAMLLDALNMDRREDLARHVLHLTEPEPCALAWSMDQLGDAFPAAEEITRAQEIIDAVAGAPVVVRVAVARLAVRCDDIDMSVALTKLALDPNPDVQLAALQSIRQLQQSLPDEDLKAIMASPVPENRAMAVRLLPTVELSNLVDDPSSQVRMALAESHPDLKKALQDDIDPRCRAVAMDEERASAIISDPAIETSWRAIGEAARMQKVPLWNLGPEKPWEPAKPKVPEQWEVPIPGIEPLQPRLLGPEQWKVSAMGISGHYGLPVSGFIYAMEMGINLFFWEPNYATLSQFSSQLSPVNRDRIHLIAGTFEATPKGIRKDLERALRMLHVDKLDLFLLFWTRSWDRLNDEVRRTVEDLQKEGKAAVISLSTHDRGLAMTAIEDGWNPVMVRHSAAHRKAEIAIFPKALEHGTSIITFNNTCYGRLLNPQPGIAPPMASDCYRYTLAQKAVTICLSAPANQEQLEENLKAIVDPEIPEERMKQLLAQGDAVYQEDTIFRKLIRSL